MKITEIKEIKSIPKTTRDSNGTETKIIEEVAISRKVKVISGGSRFGHYILDAVFILIIAVLLNAIGFNLLDGGEMSGFYFNSNGSGFQVNYSGYVVTLLYYAISEIAMGTTPAKAILGRVVINEYAEKPDFGTLILRTIIRIVPFEPLSCLGDRGWHDTWSKTWVVSKSEQIYLKKAINGDEYLDDEILDF